MRFIPAPGHLAAHALGVTVLRTAQPCPVVTPAHALAIFTLVHRGALHGAAQSTHAGALVGQGSAATARVVVAGPGTVCASLLCRASVLPLLSGEPAWKPKRQLAHAHALKAALDAMGRLQDEAVAESWYAQAAREDARARWAQNWLRGRRRKLRRQANRALLAWRGVKAPW